MSDNFYDEDGSKNKNKKHNVESLAISNIMRNEDSRNFIWKHLQSAGVFESTFNKDPIQHAFNAGLRESGLQLERDIKAATPGDYLKMIKENI